jgi:hypothetical protein
LSWPDPSHVQPKLIPMIHPIRVCCSLLRSASFARFPQSDPLPWSRPYPMPCVEFQGASTGGARSPLPAAPPSMEVSKEGPREELHCKLLLHIQCHVWSSERRPVVLGHRYRRCHLAWRSARKARVRSSTVSYYCQVPSLHGDCQVNQTAIGIHMIQAL